jgi:tryptophanyl-tRNA synthetase
VDLHAITVRQDPEVLRQNIRRVAASYVACGLDTEKSTIFVQSDVPAHAELAWVLNTYTPIGELERMTQYKDKAARHADNINAGLFTYPSLMAADILLYDSEVVPVGDDQKQHIELTRNIAQRMNHVYERELFVVPEGIFQKLGARIMGLDDPEKKMSKSAGEWNSIALSDEPDVVRKKIKRAVTDSGSAIRAGDDKPALTNLLTIYSLVSGKTVAALQDEYAGKGYGDFKTDLGEVLVEWLRPIRHKTNDLLGDRVALDEILEHGAEKAHAIAERKLRDVYHTVGLGR